MSVCSNLLCNTKERKKRDIKRDLHTVKAHAELELNQTHDYVRSMQILMILCHGDCFLFVLWSLPIHFDVGYSGTHGLKKKRSFVA